MISAQNFSSKTIKKKEGINDSMRDGKGSCAFKMSSMSLYYIHHENLELPTVLS